MQKNELNDVNQDTSQTINEMMSDERTDEANSEASDDLYMVDVDDCDNADEVDVSNPSGDIEESAEKVVESSGPKDASAELLSSGGSAASQENSQRSGSSRQYQPFVELKRLEPAEIKRFTASTASSSAVAVSSHNAKSRYAISGFLSVWYTTIF